MRFLSFFLILVFSSAILAGCNNSEGPAPEDDAFQKQLADAAAKNKDKPLPTKSGVGKVEDAKAKDANAPKTDDKATTGDGVAR